MGFLVTLSRKKADEKEPKCMFMLLNVFFFFRYLRKNIEVALQRFEAQDMTAIVEFKTLLDHTKLARDIMSEFVNIHSFDVSGFLGLSLGPTTEHSDIQIFETIAF